MRAWTSIAALLILAACGTPQQQCIAGQTRELRLIDRLIAETGASLARGYGIERRTDVRTGFVPCGPVRRGSDGRRIDPGLCLDDRPVTVRVPVAIDPAAERRKLAGLQERRAALETRAAAAIAACRAQYPD